MIKFSRLLLFFSTSMFQCSLCESYFVHPFKKRFVIWHFVNGLSHTHIYTMSLFSNDGNKDILGLLECFFAWIESTYKFFSLSSNRILSLNWWIFFHKIMHQLDFNYNQIHIHEVKTINAIQLYVLHSCERLTITSFFDFITHTQTSKHTHTHTCLQFTAYEVISLKWQHTHSILITICLYLCTH